MKKYQGTYLRCLTGALGLCLALSPLALAGGVNVQKKIKELNSGKAKTRAAAVDSLGKAQAGEAASALIARLGTEKDPAVRGHIVHSLSSLKAKEAVPVIVKSAQEDPVANVRSMSCLALGVMGDASANPQLINILNNDKENDSVRISAGNALTFYITEPGAKEALEAALKGGNRILKLGLVNGLRTVRRTEDGKYLLTIASSDNDEEVRNLGRELLKG